ncbi:MAG: hypothetical protein EA409_02105 [Saprospirales bacterium]|nr:MAG: hypothetical protein EA409_02105 [Saprospirales bacterium]
MVAKLLKDGIVILVGAFAAALLFLSLLVFLRSDRIKEAVAEAVNSSIETRFTYRDFSLSIISTFPEIRASLKEVHLTGVGGLPFIYTEELDIRLDLRSAFKSELDIRSVNLRGGAIYFIDKEGGEPNYNVFVQSDQSSSNKFSLNVLFRKLSLRDMLIITDLESSGSRQKKYIPSMLLTGKLSNQSLHINLDGGIVTDFIDVNDLRLLENKEINLDGSLVYELEKKLFRFNELNWKIKKLQGVLDGYFSTIDNSWKVDGKIVPSPVSDLISLIPVKGKWDKRVVLSKGLVSGSFMAEGDATVAGGSSFSLSAIVKDGNFYFPLENIELQSVNGALDMKRPSTGPMTLRLHDFKGHSGQSSFNLNGTVTDSDKRYFDLQFSGVLQSDELNATLTNRFPVIHKTGFIDLHGLHLLGSIGETGDFSINSLSGELSFNGNEFELYEENFHIKSGSLKIEDGGEWLIADLEMMGLGSAINAEGKATASNILETSQSWFNADQPISIALSADRIHLGDWLAFFENFSRDKDTQIRASIQKTPGSKSDWALSIQFYCGDLFYESAEVKELNGFLYSQSGNGLFSAAGLHAGGMVEMDGHFSTLSNAGRDLSLRLSANGLSIFSLMSQWDNFKQEVVKSEHLSGKLQGHMKALLKWSSEGEFKREFSEVIAAVEIDSGRLRDFPLLQGFSRYINEEELSDIVFEKLSNVIWMRDGAVFIPELFIKNNALNLSVSGAHTLDQDFRYGIRLNAGEYLAERLFRRSRNSGVAANSRGGLLMLNYLLEGSPDAFNYRTSNAAVGSIFRQTNQLKDRAIESLLESFDALPFFQLETTNDIIPEFPFQSYEHEDYEYIRGFHPGT